MRSHFQQKKQHRANNNTMKFIGNYFPFMIISLLLYGLFFYFHTESPIETEVELNSGKQAIQVQLNTVQPEEGDATTPSPTPSLTAEEVEVEQLNKAVAAEKSKLNAQRKADIKIAKKQYRESLKQHDASTDALLKEQIFNDDLAAKSIARAEAAANKKQTLKAQKKSVKETSAGPASIASILPITDPVPDTTKSPAKIIPKSPAPEKSAQTMKPKITSKAPPKVAPSKSEVATPVETAPKTKRTFKPKQAAESTPSSNDSSVPSAATEQGVLQDAEVVSGNKPDYPRRAILRNLQGRVLVKMTVMGSGKTKEAAIVKSSGHSILDNEVLNFISRELFIPALRGHEKITTEQLFSFRFELN